MKWLFRNRKKNSKFENTEKNGHEVKHAIDEAKEAIKSAEDRWPKVEKAKRDFAEQLDMAFVRRRHS